MLRQASYLLVGVLAVVCVGTVGSAGASPSQAGASPSHGPIIHRQNPARTGHDGGAEPVNLKLLWAYNPNGDWTLSSPLAAGGRVYATSCYQDVDTKTYGTIFCLDAATGKPVWEVTKVENQPLKGFFSSPALSGDGKYLVIGQGLHDDKDSDLLCFEAATGKVHWRIKTPLHVESSPAIVGDMVVAGAGAIEGADHKPKSDPGFVLAVRISDGKELWRCAVADPESCPAISAEGIVYTGSGFQGNAVVALRSETVEELKKKGQDRVLWRTAVPYPVTGTVTLIDDLVVIGAGNSDYVYANPNPAGLVVALDARSGQVRWKAEFPDAVLGAIAAREGKLIVPVRNGEVVALAVGDGKVLWRQTVPGKAAVLAGPALGGRYVYAVSGDGFLVVLDAGDGKVLERHQINDEANPGDGGLSISSATVSDGRVYVGSETGGIRCFSGK